MQYFKDGRTLSVIAYTMMMFIGYGAFYNYVTPYLILLFPSTEGFMSIILLMLGIASFLGNMIGGHAADRIGYRYAMLIGALLQFCLAGFILIAQPNQWVSVVLIILWLTSAWFTGLQINTGIAQVTKNKSSFMISINSSAIQLGGAVGSSISAVIIAQTDIKNIIYVAMAAGLGISIIQLTTLKTHGSELIGDN